MYNRRGSRLFFFSNENSEAVLEEKTNPDERLRCDDEPGNI